jgi:hypothetical protein
MAPLTIDHGHITFNHPVSATEALLRKVEQCIDRANEIDIRGESMRAVCTIFGTGKDIDDGANHLLIFPDSIALALGEVAIDALI